MNHRATKKETDNGETTLHHPPPQTLSAMARRACLPSQSGNTAEAGDLTRTAHPCLWLITWDPSQPTATRPLAIQKDATWYTYGWDLTKNICEVYGQHGYIRTNYTYSPFGQVTATGDVTQPIQWSSEYHDTELALVYYNYRHYNPVDGRWLGRDLLKTINLYSYVTPISKNDFLGLSAKNEKIMIKSRVPIFLQPTLYGDSPGAGCILEEDVNRFYEAVLKLMNKQKNCKPCYKVAVELNDAVSSDLVLKYSNVCDIIFLIGHGAKRGNKEYIRLKDREICLDEIKVERVIPIGCYVGEIKGKITHTGMINRLTEKINAMAQDDSCPRKNVCIFSGPIN